MTRLRVCARLDVKSEHLVKGIQLDGLRKIGDPFEYAERYVREGADEIIIVDVVASLYQRSGMYDLISRLSRSLRIPLTVVGGIRSLRDAELMFEAGADKVGINSASFRSPEVLGAISSSFGEQAVVASVEVKRTSKSNFFCYANNGRDNMKIELVDWLRELNTLGCGEILLTSIDRDGGLLGPEWEFIDMARKVTELPMIYSGGIACEEDVLSLSNLGVDAVAIASILHYKKSSISSIKSLLDANNVEVRDDWMAS